MSAKSILDRGSNTMKVRLLALLVLLSFSIGIVNIAQAAMERLSIVGSAGTVDETALAQVDLSGSGASIKSAVLSGNVEIRYNVVTPRNSNLPGKGLTLRALFVDNGDVSRVIARLRGVNTLTGADTVLAEIDSNREAPSFAPQSQTRNSCGVHGSLDSHYVEVVLSKTAPGGNPVILVLQVDDIGCTLRRK
jgi:hypothetical protein